MAPALIRTDVPQEGEGRDGRDDPGSSGLEAGAAAALWPEEERSHVVRPRCQRASQPAPGGQIRSVFPEMCQKCSRSTSQPVKKKKKNVQRATKVKRQEDLEVELTYHVFDPEWLHAISFHAEGDGKHLVLHNVLSERAHHRFCENRGGKGQRPPGCAAPSTTSTM